MKNHCEIYSGKIKKKENFFDGLALECRLERATSVAVRRSKTTRLMAPKFAPDVALFARKTKVSLTLNFFTYRTCRL